MKELESEITQLDFDIEQEKMRSYSYLTVPMIQKYLQSAIYGEITDMAVRKRLVNTFVREVIYSPDKIIITLNFTDRYDTPDITPDYIKDIEKQSETEAAFPLPQSSNILASFPPKSLENQAFSRDFSFSVMIDFVKVYVHFGILLGNFARNLTARNPLRHKGFQTSSWIIARNFSVFL